MAGPPLSDPKKNKTIEDLLSRNRFLQGPGPWFILLAIPVLLAVYGLVQEAHRSLKAGPAPLPVIEYAPPAESQEAADAREAARIHELWSGQGEQAGSHLSLRSAGRACVYDEALIGRTPDKALQQRLKTEKQAFRILPPGALYTKDYNPARLNFDTDAGGLITRIWCG